ncbi:MAG: lactate utilization protein C [Mycobacteriales bacterium]
MSAREQVLARVRSALGADPEVPSVPRDYRPAGDHLPGAAELVELLEDRLRDYRAGVRRASREAVPQAVAAALAEHGSPSVVVPPGLPADWVPGAVVDDPPLDVQALDRTGAVVTACAVAIAETGTLVLDGSPDQGRRAVTLVPDLHVCVVPVGQIVGTVPEALARLDPLRPLTFVSGPSATSDIELERVEGVHGPRRLEVVVVED